MSEDVKSAQRVMQIFEYFANRRRPASVMDIGRALGYPQSSVSGLVRTLVNAGYLDFDRTTRLYVPNVRLALIANWVGAGREANEELIRRCESLHAATGETIVLAMLNGIHVEYVYVLESEKAVRFYMHIGSLRPSTLAATGQALLAVKPERQLSTILRQVNAGLEPQLRVDEAAFQKTIAKIRTQGYAMSRGVLTPGGCVIAMLVPEALAGGRLAIGVAGPTDRLRKTKDSIIAAMRNAIGETPAAAAAGSKASTIPKLSRRTDPVSLRH